MINVGFINIFVKLNEILEKKLGYHPSVLRYPYRAKLVKGKLKLIKDPSKGLKK
jgi:hypothetical protein